MHFPDRAVYCPACGHLMGYYDREKSSPLKCRNRKCKAEMEVTIVAIKQGENDVEYMNFSTKGTTTGTITMVPSEKKS